MKNENSENILFFQVHHNNYKTGSAIFAWVVAGAKKEIISLLSVQKKNQVSSTKVHYLQ
jgi:hypothetical protein